MSKLIHTLFLLAYFVYNMSTSCLFAYLFLPTFYPLPSTLLYVYFYLHLHLLSLRLLIPFQNIRFYALPLPLKYIASPPLLILGSTSTSTLHLHFYLLPLFYSHLHSYS